MREIGEPRRRYRKRKAKRRVEDGTLPVVGVRVVQAGVGGRPHYRCELACGCHQLHPATRTTSLGVERRKKPGRLYCPKHARD